MQRNKQLTQEIVNFGMKAGTDIIGFADPSHFTSYESKHRPSYYLENTKTVIIIGIALWDITLDTWCTYGKPGSDRGGFQFADSVLENLCYRLVKKITKTGFNSVVLPYSPELPDSPGIFLKEAAALAGIGPIGKNNLVLTQEFGSQVRLRGIVTEAPLECGEPIHESKYCKDCTACIEACPVNALVNGYNKPECLSYQLNNLKLISSNAAIWCQACIEVCPIYGDGKWKKSYRKQESYP